MPVKYLEPKEEGNYHIEQLDDNEELNKNAFVGFTLGYGDVASSTV